MAKVPFTKLKCKINTSEIPVQLGNETIAVRQYLPVQEKLEMISRIVMYAHEQDQNYSNPVKAEIITDLELVFTYTNISFTEAQKKDLAKLYDMLYSSGTLDTILDAIPEEEKDIIYSGVIETIESVYKYQNSVLGILDTVKKDYSDTEFNIENLQQALQSEDFSFLKDVVSKLD